MERIESDIMKFEIKQIGTIYSPYKTKEECSIQGAAEPEGKGTVKVFPEYMEALETICILQPRSHHRYNDGRDKVGRGMKCGMRNAECGRMRQAS